MPIYTQIVPIIDHHFIFTFQELKVPGNSRLCSNEGTFCRMIHQQEPKPSEYKFWLLFSYFSRQRGVGVGGGMELSHVPCRNYNAPMFIYRYYVFRKRTSTSRLQCMNRDMISTSPIVSLTSDLTRYILFRNDTAQTRYLRRLCIYCIIKRQFACLIQPCGKCMSTSCR